MFDKLDRDGNGRLSRSELQLSISERAFRAKDAAAIVALWKDEKTIANLVDDGEWKRRPGISRQDLQALQERDGDAQTTFANRVYQEASKRIEMATPELFPDGLASITPDAVRQGSLGVCYFLSAASALAAVDPQAIKDMVSANDDGSYTVRFPSETVTVPPLSDGDYGQLSETGGGAWVAVLEKAFLQTRPNADRGGLTAGIRKLTGERSSILVAMSPLMNLDRFRQRLSEASDEGRLMVASRTWSTNGELSTYHVYTIMDYDPTTDLMTLRDPHGDTGPQGDGYYQMTPQEFREQFDLVAIQRRR